MREHEENGSSSDTSVITWLMLGVLIFLLAGGAVGGVVMLQMRKMRAFEAERAQQRALEAHEALEAQKAAEQEGKP